jgi:hypothetical protein
MLYCCSCIPSCQRAPITPIGALTNHAFRYCCASTELIEPKCALEGVVPGRRRAAASAGLPGPSPSSSPSLGGKATGEGADGQTLVNASIIDEGLSCSLSIGPRIEAAGPGHVEQPNWNPVRVLIALQIGWSAGGVHGCPSKPYRTDRRPS